MWNRLAIQPLRRLALGALEAVLPARCLGCGDLVNRQGSLCPSCWRGIDFLGEPLCTCCGMPFEQNVGEGALCGGCIGRPPRFARARAVFRYSESSRQLVLGFKHGDRIHGAPAYGRWMARAGATLLADASVIAPVPLHWTRLFRRRYNQAALLAQVLAAVSGVPHVPDLLVRRRRTPPQGRLNAVERRRNMRAAFALNKRFATRIGGRRVLLVDDVFTTGATVNACADVLLEAGAEEVDVLTLARVVRPRALD